MIGVGTCKISARARRYVNQVLTAERLSYGPFTQKFERQFAAVHQCRFGVVTSSGTCALMIALAALKNRHQWNDGDEVIVPAVTFVATSNIVLQLNMKPVFVDVDSVYYELDPAKIEAAITPRTRCIIPVHLFGHPADMVPIAEIANRHGLRIIEDSCETMFATLNGVSVGAFGDIGCFSTYVAHLLTTGVGGICTTNDPDLAVNLRSLMNHGRDSIYISIDDDKNKSKEELDLIIKRRFNFVQMGYSFRLTEMEGALGLAALEEHEEMMVKRRFNGRFFSDRLKPFDSRMQLPTVRPNADHSFMMYPVVMRDEPKTAIVSHLEEHGIETREMLPLVNQPYYRDHLHISEDDFPVAKWINHNGFYFAAHQGLTDLEREYIVEVFESYFHSKPIKKEKNCLILMSKGDGMAAQLLLETLPLELFDEYIFAEASPDQETTEFFRKYGFRIIQEPLNKGAILEKAVLSSHSKNIIVFGADGANDPSDIQDILLKLKEGNDLVIASRFLPGGKRQSTRRFSHRSLGNRLFSFLLSSIFSANVSDGNNIFRGFQRDLFLRLIEHRPGERVMFESTVLALRQGMKIDEVVTTERPVVTTRKRHNRVLTAFSCLGILFRALVLKKYSRGEVKKSDGSEFENFRDRP